MRTCMGPMLFVLLAAACGSSSRKAAEPSPAGTRAAGHAECELVVGCLKDLNGGEEPTADEVAETRAECDQRLDAASPELLAAISDCANGQGACDGVADCTMMTDPSQYTPEEPEPEGSDAE